MSSGYEEKNLLPHHEQQPLCTNRLPYRQGRIFTAVKVYSINNESNHLLVFGVPSINLRQEAKALLSKFGKLKQFVLSKDHPGEQFTETYHAVFDKIQSARLAKKMLDTKSFYGSPLHISYAPEFETVCETKEKLLKRQRDVIFRLKTIENDNNKTKNIINKVSEETSDTELVPKLNMGENNVISFCKDSDVTKRKRKTDTSAVIEKKFKPCFVSNSDINSSNNVGRNENNSNNIEKGLTQNNSDNIDVIDCTSIENETVTNINEHLNYNNFGNELIRQVPQKVVNKIKFNLSNKKL